MDKNLKREIILDNYQNPFHFAKGDDSYIKVNTNNESCIDDLDIYFKILENKVIDVKFSGEACAISTSATSIMLRNLIGKTFEEIKVLLDNYKKMINEEVYDQEILKDLLVFDTICLQPNRKNCALLPVKAIEKMMENYN